MWRVEVGKGLSGGGGGVGCGCGEGRGEKVGRAAWVGALGSLDRLGVDWID